MTHPISGIVLAAGLSRRAAPANKLLAPFGETTVVRATVTAMCGAGLHELIVVTGHDAAAVEAALHGLPVRCVFAADYARGMGRSLAAGIREASVASAGFAVCPGDLPHLSIELVDRIVRVFVGAGARHHTLPMAEGRRGHPVILGAWLRADLEDLPGDEGARSLLARATEAARCRHVDVGDPAIWNDVDTLPGNATRRSRTAT